jgi:class 3 adenylate cyclase
MISNKLKSSVKTNADFVTAPPSAVNLVNKHQSTKPSLTSAKQEGRQGRRGQRRNMRGSVLSAPKRDQNLECSIYQNRQQLIQPRCISSRTINKSNSSGGEEQQTTATTKKKNAVVGTTCSTSNSTISSKSVSDNEDKELSMLRKKQELLHSLLPQEIVDNIHHHWSPHSTPGGRQGRGSPPGTKEQQQPHQQGGGNHDQFQRDSLLCDSSIPSSIVLHANNADLTTTTSMLEISNHTATSEGIVSTMSNSSSSTLLYRENAFDVSMVFVDIVGFSRISEEIPASGVMDMLQDVFNRFDEICKDHKILKLDTIGDAYLCSSGGLSCQGVCDDYGDKHSENQQEQDDVRQSDSERLSQHSRLSHAMRALAAAKDMVREARKVLVPRSSIDDEKEEYLSVRVGIHVGDATFGVLGLSLPKLVCIGSTVNMAARMEQTCTANMIHVTEAFHDLIGDNETGWECKEKVQIKNMGEVNAYLLDPFKREDESCWV